MVSSGVYYTINNRLQFFYKSGCLVLDQQEVKLDPLESLVLEELTKQPKEIIATDTLLDLWPTSATSPNSLTRVISTLRKKLRTLDDFHVEIKNYPKKGYALIAEVDHLSAQTPKVQLENRHTKPTRLTAKTPIIGILFIAVVLLINYAATFVFEKTEDSVSPVLDKAIQLVDDQFEKVDLSVNDTHTQVVYATRDNEQANWQLKVLDTYSLESRVISEAGVNLRSPDWLNNDTLIYRAYGDNSCAIKKLDLLHSDAHPIAMFPCNELTTGKGLSVLSADTILFTDAAHDIAPASLYKGNIRTGKVTKIPGFDSSGVGAYNIQSKAGSNLVAVLTSTDWSTSNIHLVDTQDNWRSIWQTNTPKAKHSVSWDGQSLFHANESGGVTAHLFDASRYVKSIEMSGFSKLYNFVGNNGSVAFIQGNMYRTDILMSPIHEPKSTATLLVDSRASNKLAQFIDENTVLYVSDVTGIEQLWLVDIKTQTKKQLSMFAKAQKIDHIAYSVQKGLVAIEADKTISLYTLAGGKVSGEGYQQFAGTKPLFFEDNLLFSTHDDSDNYRIDALNLENQTLKNSFLIGAHDVKVSNDRLYYTKYYQPGLWQYHEQKDDDLISAMSQDVSYWFVDGQQLLFKAQDDMPTLVDLTNNQFTQLNESTCQFITDYQFSHCLGQAYKPNNTQLMLAETNR